MKSDTPRADANRVEPNDSCNGYDYCKHGSYVMADFAEELELENQKLTEEIKRLEELLKSK